MSDLHLSATKPAGHFGSDEAHLGRQEKYLECLFDLCEIRHPSYPSYPALRMKGKEATIDALPLVIGGDIFHTPNEPVSFVSKIAEIFGANWDIPVYMIPGQHDLPYHDNFYWKDSAYGLLVHAANGLRCSDTHNKVVKTDKGSANRQFKGVPILTSLGISRQECFRLSKSWHIALHSYGWYYDSGKHGSDMKHLFEEGFARIPGMNPHYGIGKTLGVFHRYVHIGEDTTWIDNKIPSLLKPIQINSSCKTQYDYYQQYTTCLFGDNHIPFHTVIGGNHIYNHGVGFPRKTDERKFPMEIGVLMEDGSVYRYNISKTISIAWKDGSDSYTAPDKELKPIDGNAAWTEFMEAAKELSTDTSIDFKAVCLKLLSSANLSKGARKQILELLPDDAK